MTEPMPPQRVATMDDADRISALMKASVLAVFPRFYDEAQTASAAIHVAHLDTALVEDGTYFVHEVGGELVACGGWSRRGRLYTGAGDHDDDARLLDPATEAAHVRAMFVDGRWTRRGLGRAILESSRQAAQADGFTRLDLMATLPGVPLYESFGFVAVGRAVVTMPDGVALECLEMARPVDIDTDGQNRG
jgi:GNAT superfamily N-acetyltransferase